MKKRGKLKIISWITTLAMIISIFNIPLVGYATENAEPSTSSETETYMVVGSGFYVEGEDHEVGDRIDLEATGDDTFVGYCSIPNTYIESEGIKIAVAEYDIEDTEESDPLKTEIFTNIEDVEGCTYAPMSWSGDSSAVMTVEYTDLNGVQKTISIYIDFYNMGEDEGDEGWVCEECGNDPCTCVSATIYYSLKNGKQIETNRYFGVEHERYMELPYSYDGEGITLVASYYDMNAERDVEETVEIAVDESGMYDFTLGNGEEYTLEIYVAEEPSSETGAEIAIIFSDRDNYYISYSDMTNEAGVMVYEYVVPFGYDEISFNVNLYGEVAEVVHDYDSDEDFYNVNMSSGEVTREFKVVAEDEDYEQAYRITFVESTGESTDVDVEAYYYVNNDHPMLGNYRSEFVEFEDSVDEDGNAIANGKVTISRFYDQSEGVNINVNSNDSVEVEYPVDEYDNSITGPFEPGDTASFTVTSANGQNSKTYYVEFVLESEEASKAIGFETFTVTYVNADGETVTEDVDVDKASADGAVIKFDEETIGNNINEYDDYYVNVYAKTDKNSLVVSRETNAFDYDNDSDDEITNYDLDISKQGVVSLVLEVVNSNGFSKTFTVKLVNMVKAVDPEINNPEIEYTDINGYWQWDSIYFTEDGVGEVKLRPYYSAEDYPIIVYGYTADGTKFEKRIYKEDFVDGKYEFTILSKAYMAEEGKDKPAEKEYKIVIFEPTAPMVMVVYKDIWYGEGFDDFTEEECEIKDDNTGKIRIPYSSSDVSVEVTLLNGESKTITPVWNEDNSASTVKFTDENGTAYTVNIEKEAPSNSTDLYVELFVQYSEDEEDCDWFYFSGDAYNEKNELTITIPKDVVTTNLHVSPTEYGTLAKGESFIENLSPGVLKYTVVAEDGEATEDYTIYIVESAGNSTDVDMSIDFEIESGYYYGTEIEFEEQNGTMVTNYTLPCKYNEEKGVTFYNRTIEKVTIEGDFVDTYGGTGTLYPSDENGWSFDFVVTAADGKTKQNYRINFAKESEEEAKIAEMKTLWLRFKATDLRTYEYDVDLTKVSDGNIDLHIPELDQFEGYVDLEVVAKGYGTIAKISEADREYEDYGASWLGYDAETIGEEYEIDIVIKSSDESATKSYDLKIRTDKGTSNAHIANWNNGKTIDATCEKDGSITYSCNAIGCGEKTVTTIPAKKHDYVKTVTAPTCTENGYTTYTCKHDASHTYKTDEVASVGHSFGEYVTTTKAGFGKAGEQTATCSACQATDVKPIAAAVVPVISDQTFNNKTKSPTVTVKDAEGNKIASKATFAAKSRKAVGKYKVTVKLTGDNYEGSKTVYFKINPKGVSLSKVTAGKKSFTAKWKKPSSTYRKQMSGYQIKYSTSSKMSKAKTVTVKGTKATSKTIKKLKAKKYYYVQIRTYKTVKGAKYYSSWSKTKKVKTK